MAKYRITEPHFINNEYLLPGTLVGDGTPYAVSQPSLSMEPLDDEATAAVKAVVVLSNKVAGSNDPLFMMGAFSAAPATDNGTDVPLTTETKVASQVKNSSGKNIFPDLTLGR